MLESHRQRRDRRYGRSQCKGWRMSAFNLAQRIYIDDDWTVCEITNMIDRDGEETDDPDEAIYIVAKRSENEWITVNVVEDVESVTN